MDKYDQKADEIRKAIYQEISPAKEKVCKQLKEKGLLEYDVAGIDNIIDEAMRRAGSSVNGIFFDLMCANENTPAFNLKQKKAAIQQLILQLQKILNE